MLPAKIYWERKLWTQFEKYIKWRVKIVEYWLHVVEQKLTNGQVTQYANWFNGLKLNEEKLHLNRDNIGSSGLEEQQHPQLQGNL